MITDPYGVLGVSPDASEEEIARSYRKLAKKYHPDVNPGNAEAARRMSEVNAAYEQIKSGKTSGTAAGGYQGQEAGGGSASRGQEDPFGFGFNPFEGFDFFGQGPRQESADFAFRTVIGCLNAGRYEEAIEELNGMGERGAAWYYYSALANSCSGNRITALQHAKTAVQMEPENPEYRRILNRIQNGGQAYQQQSREYGMPTGNLGRICLGVILTNLFCMCCGRPC